MKILSVNVRDPRREGEYKNPILEVEVDEEIHMTNSPTEKGSYKITTFGPFITVDEPDRNSNDWQNANLGKFNTLNLHRESLVEVLILSPDEEFAAAMGITRARRLLKNSTPYWHYIMDDLAGQRGEALWRLKEMPLKCIYDEKIQKIEERFYRGVHLALCPTHLHEYNVRIGELRQSANS